VITYAVELLAELWRVHDGKSMTQTVRFTQDFVVLWQLSCTTRCNRKTSETNMHTNKHA